VPRGATLLRQLPLATAAGHAGAPRRSTSRVASALGGAVHSGGQSGLPCDPCPTRGPGAGSRKVPPRLNGRAVTARRDPRYGLPIRGLSHRPERTAPDPVTTHRFGGFAENGLIRARSVGCRRESISHRSNTQRPSSASLRSVWSGAGCRSTCWDLEAAPHRRLARGLRSERPIARYPRDGTVVRAEFPSPGGNSGLCFAADPSR